MLHRPMHQNLARERAIRFGRPDKIDESNPVAKLTSTHTFHSPSNSVLVTEAPHHTEIESEEWRETEVDPSQPRGFFADQFEVSMTVPAVSVSHISRVEFKQLQGSFSWYWTRDMAADQWSCWCLRQRGR